MSWLRRPGTIRVLTWFGIGFLYAAIGSQIPFVLLLGWWEAVPAVAFAIVVSDRLSRRYGLPAQMTA